MEIHLDPRQMRQSPSPLPPGFDIREFRAERQRLIDRRMILGQVPLTRAFPVPRPVALGPGRYLAEELRLSDLAALQGWIEAQVGDPMEGHPPGWADPDPATRPDRLLALWASSSGWYPTPATPRGAALLTSPSGRRFFLGLVLGRHHPDLTDADLDAILAQTTPAQWGALVRVAYGVSPKMEILAELAPDDEGGPTNWPKNIVAIMREYCLTFVEVADLTLSQWRLLCSDGATPEGTKASQARGQRVHALRRAAEARRRGGQPDRLEPPG